MTIYNSQHIDNDPFPYRLPDGSRDRHPLQHTWRPDGTIGPPRDFGAKYDPRPKYENNPNRVLVAFRQESRWDRINNEGKALEVSEWLWWLSDKTHNVYRFQEHAHIEHAIKVLTRLDYLLNDA